MSLFQTSLNPGAQHPHADASSQNPLPSSPLHQFVDAVVVALSSRALLDALVEGVGILHGGNATSAFAPEVIQRALSRSVLEVYQEK